MQKFYSVIFVFILVFAPVSASSGQKWYEGGTLHKSNTHQWKRATYRNKLATAADWVVATKIAKNLQEAKSRGQELVTCIDEAVSAPNTPEQKSNDVAVLCMILLGWK